MPSPLDVPNIKGINPKDGSDMERRSADDEPMSALAFKIMNDPFVGTLTFVRVYSGAPCLYMWPHYLYMSAYLGTLTFVRRWCCPCWLPIYVAACLSTYYLYLCVCPHACACVVAAELAAS